MERLKLATKGTKYSRFFSHIHTSNEHTDGPKPSSHGAETFKLFTGPVGTGCGGLVQLFSRGGLQIENAGKFLAR